MSVSTKHWLGAGAPQRRPRHHRDASILPSAGRAPNRVSVHPITCSARHPRSPRMAGRRMLLGRPSTRSRAGSEWGRTQDSPVDELPHKRMNQHLPGTRSRPGTRCGRHSCPNTRQSPARVGLGTIDMGREARPGRYLRPGPNRPDPIDQTPSQSLLTATFGSWWVPFERRAAFVLATTSSVRESTLVSSSGLLHFRYRVVSSRACWVT